MEEQEAEGRAARLGVLKVVVAQGTNLAIRDFTSSDPYVVVRLADRNAKTKVINSCLNPVWNEEMVFSIKEPVGVIKFVLYQEILLRTKESKLETSSGIILCRKCAFEALTNYRQHGCSQLS